MDKYIKQVTDWCFAPFESETRKVIRLCMNSYNIADLLTHGRDTIDMISDRILIEEGLVGNLFGAEVRVTKQLPKNVVQVILHDDSSPKLDLARHILFNGSNLLRGETHMGWYSDCERHWCTIQMVMND